MVKYLNAISVLLLLVSFAAFTCVISPLKNYPAAKSSQQQPMHTCCMPREHTFHFEGSKTMLENCNGMNCNSGFGVFRQRHMPDFYNRRYRLDSRIEINGQLVVDNTVMGFMDPYPSSFGVEYTFNSTSCSCRKLTKQGEMLMVTCVEFDFDFEGDIAIGIETEDHVKAQKFVRRKQVNSNTTEIDTLIVQPIQRKAPPLPYPDPYPCYYDCAIISMEGKTQIVDSNGGMISVSSYSGGSWNFKPFNTDADYVIPSHCQKS